MKWSKGLEGEVPREIASTDKSPLRVLSGPGTGKTFALMRRITRLLEVGVDPNRILVCTFARTAARQLKEEVSKLGVDGATDIHASTLHSYCFTILNRNAVIQLTGRTPRTIAEFEKRFLLEDLKSEEFSTIKACKNRLSAFEAAWARLQTDDPGIISDPIDVAFESNLYGWLQDHDAMLIDELVPVTLRYLQDNPASDELGRFDHVLVDEYQDLNRAEQEIIDLIACEGSLTIVGDEDQSIYSFKYAHPQGIADFDESHPGTHDLTLKTCRRCPSNVVDIANSLIARNERLPRKLEVYPENGEGDVHIVQWKTASDEALGLAKFVNHKITSENVDPGDILILASRRQFADALCQELSGYEIPTHSFFKDDPLTSGLTSLDTSREAQALSLLRLLTDPNDKVALRCWCGFGSQNLRSPAWKRVREVCDDNEIGIPQALWNIESDEIAIPYSSALEERMRELKQALSKLEQLTGHELVDALFPPSEDWAEVFREVGLSLDDDCSAKELLDDIEHKFMMTEMPRNVDYIRVMSLYKSKGLTADLVVVVGCIQGALPSQPKERAAAKKHLQEQRRLFYVAITRTRRTLVLSNATRLPRADAYSMRVQVARSGPNSVQTIASQFLWDLGAARPQPVTGGQFLSATGAG